MARRHAPLPAGGALRSPGAGGPDCAGPARRAGGRHRHVSRLSGRRPHRGGPASMREVIDDNARALTESALPREAVDALNHASASALSALGSRLEARRADGFVRQCHGDLHLRNIVLLDEAPVLFDAIDFNDDFACIDVWYDTAFLLMDLLARGRPAEANRVFNQYVLRTWDIGGLPLLPFFLGCRAAIRAKTSLAAAALAGDRARREDLHRRAGEYLDLAVRVLHRPAPRLIAVGGLSAPASPRLRRTRRRKWARRPERSSSAATSCARCCCTARRMSASAPRRTHRRSRQRSTDRRSCGRPTSWLRDGPSSSTPRSSTRAGVRAWSRWPPGPERTSRACGSTRLRTSWPIAWRTGTVTRRTRDASVVRRQLARDTGPLDWPRVDASGEVDAVTRRVRDHILD
ncbi:MAG: phosphotransferase [Vicinamibacterales bacterium]